ncbi:BrnT family toxin [Frigidibacter oleivorans]|uniref:BrnT family toxin n=1 Tax=Frigidibacter oleivorans TaxID=2487129 RepID=UPI000F8D95FD|nr:BrnT family toxin [Frigidibacter oleivorans]
MDVEWDEDKDAANRAKHGLALAEAANLDWARAVYRRDLRRDYGEERIEAAAPLNGRLHICIFTMRGATRRIISLRKANAREVRRHEPG